MSEAENECKMYAQTVAACLAVFLVASDVIAKECTYPPPKKDIKGKPTVLVNECGQRYEFGYRIEGNTLYLPHGGKHSIPTVSPEQAERLFRDAYGLLGEDKSSLIRTKWQW